ncbi:MAG TPA: rhodanese-like domain-containing protein [Candidatus Aminicenantes bacterium]|nr:rhodanese-like domain-containing protein [Candidatus Aminicenantes bacterium]
MNRPIAWNTFCRVLALAIGVWAMLAAEEPPSFCDLTPAQAAALVTAKGDDPTFMILDVRTPAEFAAARMAESYHIDVKAPDFGPRVGRLDRGGVYLVVCRGGTRSRKAVDMMRAMGFQHVYNLQGGLLKWREGKFPLEGSSPASLD